MNVRMYVLYYVRICTLGRTLLLSVSHSQTDCALAGLCELKILLGSLPHLSGGPTQLPQTMWHTGWGGISLI